MLLVFVFSIYCMNRISQLDLLTFTQSIRVVSVRKLAGVRPKMRHQDTGSIRPTWATSMIEHGESLPQRHIDIIDKAIARRASLDRRQVNHKASTKELSFPSTVWKGAAHTTVGLK